MIGQVMLIEIHGISQNLKIHKLSSLSFNRGASDKKICCIIARSFFILYRTNMIGWVGSMTRDQELLSQIYKFKQNIDRHLFLM